MRAEPPWRRRWTCAAGLALTIALSARALVLTRAADSGTIGQLYHQAWGVRDGAPGAISSIAQAPDGFLWLVTPAGLYRFDGIRFERFSPPGAHLAPMSRVWALPDGRLGVAHISGAVSVLKDGVLLETIPARAPDSDLIHSLAVDRDGVMWSASLGGIFRLAGSIWVPVGSETGIPVGPTSGALYIDPNGAIWTCAADTLRVRRPGSTRFEAAGVYGAFDRITGAPDGSIWVTDQQSGSRVAIDAHGHAVENVRPLPPARQLLFDRTGALWLATEAHGVLRTSSPSQDAADGFTRSDGLTGDEAFDVFQDREGNVWVGTSGGLDLFRGTSIVVAPLPPQIHGSRLAMSSDGTLWIGSQNRPLIRMRDGVPTTVELPPPVTSLFAAPDGSLWAWSDNSLFRVEDDRVVKMADAPAGASSPWTLVRDRAGVIWTSFLIGGSYCFADGRWSRPAVPQLPPDAGRLRVAIPDESSGLWLGYEGNIVAHLHDNRADLYSTPQGLRLEQATALAQGSGHTWLAGYQGLASIVGGRLHMVPGIDESSVGRISGVAEAADGSLWLNADHGVVQIAAPEVQRVLRDAAAIPHIRVFDYLDGVIGGAKLIPQQSAVAARDGRVWFVGFDSIVSIDPAKIITNPLPPPVHIQSVATHDTTYAATAGLRLPAGTTSVDIKYTALSLTMPDRVKFRYQLEGVDPQWQEPGARREAFYTNLTQGHYTFRVIAANNDGIWNDSGASLTFAIAPQFYQTVPFRAGIVIFAIVLSWTAYRMHLGRVTRSLQGRLEERLQERERIARELHDTFLQGVQGLILRFQAIASRMPASDPASTLMEETLVRADHLLVEGRNRVQDLRPPTDAGASLPQAVGLAGQDLVRPAAIDFRVIVTGAPCDLQAVVHDEAYRIVREALLNAVQHAGARSIESGITYSSRELRIQIRDDGRGIESDVLNAGGRDKHWGLRGMRERAVRIGARLDIWSRPGAGTEVDLRVPASVAYRRTSARRPVWLHWLKAGWRQ